MSCKCFKRPIHPPECYSKCVGRYLKYVTARELILVFEFNPRLANELFTISSNDKLETLEDFLLEIEEVSDREFISNKFKELSDEEWLWIQTTLKNRYEASQVVMI